MFKNALVAFVATTFTLVVATRSSVAQIADPVSVTFRVPSADPVARVLDSGVVLVGRVTSIEKERVEVTPRASILTGGKSPSTRPQVFYTIANVKIEQRLLGAKNETHVKVGFNTGSRDVELIVGRRYLLHLVSLKDFGFSVTSYINSPISEQDDPDYEKAVAEAKKVTDVLNDPMKALKSDQASVRATAAVILLAKYRGLLAHGVTREEPISEEESRLILKGLSEADWPNRLPEPDNALMLLANNGRTSKSKWDAFTAFQLLGLRHQDGWSPPIVAIATNSTAGYKDEFKKWLDGPGKHYRIKKLVPKDK